MNSLNPACLWLCAHMASHRHNRKSDHTVHRYRSLIPIKPPSNHLSPAPAKHRRELTLPIRFMSWMLSARLFKAKIQTIYICHFWMHLKDISNVETLAINAREARCMTSDAWLVIERALAKQSRCLCHIELGIFKGPKVEGQMMGCLKILNYRIICTYDRIQP